MSQLYGGGGMSRTVGEGEEYMRRYSGYYMNF